MEIPIEKLKLKRDPEDPSKGLINARPIVLSAEMKTAVKLIDETFLWCGSSTQHFHDLNDYHVIGTIGVHAVGKSTVMSIIAGDYTEEDKSKVFRTGTRKASINAMYSTLGVDVYVTNERAILLDTQPVNISNAEHMQSQERDCKPLHVRGLPLKQSLQMLTFLMTMCNTIIIVQDWFSDLNFLRFIQSAEMLKSAVFSNLREAYPLPEGLAKHYPSIVFVQNKCQKTSFSPAAICDMKKNLSAVFKKSKLKYVGPVHVPFCQKKDDSVENVNLFLIPDTKPQNESFGCLLGEYQAHPGYTKLAKSFAYQILSLPRPAINEKSLTEKKWFYLAGRVWEIIKKSPVFRDKNRLFI